MRWKGTRTCLLLLALFAAAPAEAREWADAGGWSIFEDGPTNCMMALEYEGEGETVLGLSLGIDGNVVMGVNNWKWSAKKGQAYELVYLLNGIVYSGGKSFGYENGIRKGFVTGFEPDFLNHFAASTYLTIKTPDGKLVDDLKLDGSSAGLAQLKRCVAHLKSVAAAEAREKARFAHIPEDPFKEIAPVEGAVPDKVLSPARPRFDVAALVSRDDYPAAALRAGEQGRTGVKLDVDATGRVSGCTVTASSGSSTLDSTTCALLQRRARFTPARAASGNPMAATYETGIDWTLPK